MSLLIPTTPRSSRVPSPSLHCTSTPRTRSRSIICPIGPNRLSRIHAAGNLYFRRTIDTRNRCRYRYFSAFGVLLLAWFHGHGNFLREAHLKVIVADKISDRGVELLRSAGWNIVL